MDRSVTVIIPTNRGGAYLEEAVASVRAQTSPVHEILLVDDGSPAPGLAHTAARLGLRYLRQEASGLSVARNNGAEHAEGEWIAYLDDDDVWHPERIAAQQRALDAMPEAIASCTGGWYMDADGVRFGDGWGAPQATAERMIAYDAVPPRITTLLIRRDAYRRVGGCRTAMEPAEDNDLIQRLLQIGEFACVDRQLVGYRRHRGNVTQRGLAGREANRRVLTDLLATAEDPRLAALLRRHRRAFRRYAAAENLGEFLSATRRRERGYALRISWWGIRHVPLDSVRAVFARARRARQRVRSGQANPSRAVHDGSS
ncbi:MULTISPECIES: glycosyltransferase family 2 protein [Microbacterium]|uniref:glycosyltransferase family 2 protein n=1 Tax=Microbacterium TaxID=33882 RepID=UPI00217D9400|nr:MULTISPECIES: glycosyltransferase family A protein [Microbacterium]UWF77891.1 glycosyltransferase family 2 protein [Microbacterium neungamense]WCM56068.1 glycosyltransferase family 2 protein [Microbacterium sp. EF45047]